jgi:hypothetical protein
MKGRGGSEFFRLLAFRLRKVQIYIHFFSHSSHPAHPSNNNKKHMTLPHPLFQQQTNNNNKKKALPGIQGNDIERQRDEHGGGVSGRNSIGSLPPSFHTHKHSLSSCPSTAAESPSVSLSYVPRSGAHQSPPQPQREGDTPFSLSFPLRGEVRKATREKERET